MNLSRFDRVLQAAKDHRLLAWVLLVAVTIVGLGQLTEAVEKIYAFLRPPLPAGRSEAFERLKAAGITLSPEDFVSAAASGNYEGVKLLLEAGMDPNVSVSSSSKRPGTALGQAAVRGSIEVERLLLKSGADPAARSLRLTPLFLAAHRGHEEVVRALIDNGADVNAGGLGFHTPLMAAVMRCNKSMAESLIKAGAAIDARTSDGETALMFAVQTKECSGDSYTKREILSLLVSEGATLSATNDAGEDLIDLAREIEEPGLYEFVEQLKQLSSTSG